MNQNDRINLKGLSHDELKQFIENLGERSFRAKQIWKWIYSKNVTDFELMTNIAKPFRQQLEEVAYIGSLKIEKKQESSGGTVKFLWQLYDGHFIESVYIPEDKRRTLCISSQVGCNLGCQFCATGKLGCKRNLSPYEIVDQVLSAQRELQIEFTNLVMMGMGEPFLNYDNVIKALYIINDGEGIGLGNRRITISTAGIVPAIQQFTEENHPFRLAVSLNATTQEQRARLMPVSKKYSINDLINAVKQYTKATKSRVTFEYVLLHDENDTDEDAKRLIKLLKGFPCKLNLIAYNHTTDKFKRPSDEHILKFAEKLHVLKSPVTHRLSRGGDIQGACGQLAGTH